MAQLTTEQVLNDIADTRANINNIKNNKHDIKNINTFNDSTPNRSNQVIQRDLLARPSASSPAAQEQPLEVNGETVGHNEPSPAWKYVKIDLFDNATVEQLAKEKRVFNLKLAFLSHGRYKSMAAALNSSWKEVKRGFDFNLQEDVDHYSMLEQVYRLCCANGLERVRASKCYEPVPGRKGSSQKGPTIYGMSVVVGMRPQPGEFYCVIIDGVEVYECVLKGTDLSEAQRKGNCVATGHIGDIMRKQRKTRNDFFKGE